MKYFKNTDVAKTYGVSDKAVRNWIDAAQKNKNSLELFVHSSRLYIADTLNNESVLENLAQQGQKYRNSRSYRNLEPTAKFFTYFTSNQVLDIINNLDKHHEIPYYYRCAGPGGTYWDAYLQKLAATDRDNILKATIELLAKDFAALEETLKSFKKVRIVDLGVGNGSAVQHLIGNLMQTHKLEKYIGIDTSEALLDTTKSNIRTWTDGKLDIETYCRDFSSERFYDLLAHDDDPIYLVLLLGGTVGNFREPVVALQNIRESLGKNDYLIISNKSDSPTARRFFDFSIQQDKSELSFHNKFILDLLAIESDMYSVEQFFDKVRSARFIQVRLKVNLTLTFPLGEATKTVDFKKGDTLLLLRMWEWRDIDLMHILDDSCLDMRRVMKSEDRQYILLAAKAKSNESWIPSYETI